MANRRMFSQSIVESDAFIEMPLSSQALYFHLGMYADDDGFINSPKKIQRMIGAADGDFQMLLAKKFILCFESGVIVIKHWKMNNYIQKDRYRETVYRTEKSQLYTKKNGAYTLDPSKAKDLCIQPVYTLETGKIQENLENVEESACIQSVYKMDTQCSVSKCSVYNTTLHNITLYYYYLIGKKEKFENSTENEKKVVINALKDLDIFIDNPQILNQLEEDKKIDFMLQYWSIKELILSSHKVYFKYLTREIFFEKFFKCCDYKNKHDTKDFLDYFIKTLKNELKELAEKKVI